MSGPITRPVQVEGQGWLPGSFIGRYTLLGKIATGGMAEIWLARQAGPQGFEKVVVIKRIIDSYGKDPAFVEMFLDEARIAARLNHPNIVQVIELAEHGGAYFIAMEYLHGESLASVVSEGNRQKTPLPPALAARIVAAAAEGLSHAHGMRDLKGRPLNIVHRDISPMNLFVTYEGVVKVVDFGIAKAANRSTQTANSLVKGKVSYMAPEQARGQELDGRADVFALGVVLFEAATGTRLFKLGDHYATFAAITGDEPMVRAHEREPRVPLALSDIIQHALERDLSKRFQSAREMQEALEAWLHSEPSLQGSSAVSAYMHQLFAPRIAERNLMIERAELGEFTPSRAALLAAGGGTPSGEVVLGERTATIGEPTGVKRRRTWWIAGIAAAMVVAVAAGMLLRGEPVPVAPVVPPPPVAPATATLGVDSEPSGARVSVDGVDRGLAPVEVKDLVMGDHRLVAALPGWVTVSQTVSLSRPGERAQVVLRLSQEVVDAGVHATPPPGPAVPHGPPGKLTLDTKPWTKVYLKGKFLGDTPLIDVSLPAGKYVLKLVNEDEDVNDTAELEIKSGELTAKKLRLK